MAINYPASLDGTAQFGQPSGTSLLTQPDHAAQHDNLSSLGTVLESIIGTTALTNLAGSIGLIGSLQTAVGTTPGTSVLKNFADGDFAARVNQETLGSPTINGGTLTSPLITNHTIGSAAWTGTVAGTTTLDLGTASRQLFQFPNSAGSVLLKVSNVVVNRPFMVEILQSATGLGTIGWFGTINWMGPVGTVTTTANARDLYGFMPIGTATFIGLTMGTGGT